MRRLCEKGRRWSAAMLAAGCFAACLPPHSEPVGTERLVVERILRIRDLRAVIDTAIWPGFAAPEFDTPLVYYTDSLCYAVDPTPAFRERFAARFLCRCAGATVYKTALPDTLPFHMETQMNFSDSTAYDRRMPFLHCSSPELTRRSIPDVASDSVWLPMVLHEYAHGWQLRRPGFADAYRRRMPDIPETELGRLHKRLDWFDRAIGAENEALLAALAAPDAAREATAVARFRSLRKTRKVRMAAELGDSTLRAEEIYELMEGMARYVEAAAGFRLGTYAPDEEWLWNPDASGYFFAMGYNLVRLLHRQDTDLSQLFADSIRPLETFLTTTENTR